MNFRPTVTVDLVLSLSVHLAPSFKNSKMEALLDISDKILREWAEKIRARKLSVSLEAITWNALRLASSPKESRDLKR